MAQYRKKPVIIEAVQFDPEMKPWPDGVIPWREAWPRDGSRGYIETLEGRMHVMPRDLHADLRARR